MKRRAGKFLLYLILIVYAIISIYPLLWMLLYSFKDNTEIFVTNPFGFPKVWHFENYIDAWKAFDVGTYFKNSMIVAFFTILLVELFALLFCYVVGLTNSLWSVIVPYVALGLPFACMLFYGFYLGIPIELEESAFMEGANLGTIFFRIILPQMKSPIVVLVIYQFMSCWNEFNLALIMLTKNQIKTLPLGLVNFWTAYQAQWGQVGAAMITASVPVLVIYLFFSNQITDAMSTSGMFSSL